ncbi:hypothetical protein Fot_15054 [Forsythia ovata]|uniref:Uncharacterized protein n=1 Tax=Forsythia ovata TaxID=205694 RepID=A0ABD1W825_9LAMI
MKRGKYEEKIMGPMFPRLHVNDAEKGGPRAPPRNKMALYEQLSIASYDLHMGHQICAFSSHLKFSCKIPMAMQSCNSGSCFLCIAKPLSNFCLPKNNQPSYDMKPNLQHHSIT